MLSAALGLLQCMYCGSSSAIRDAIGNEVAGLDLKAPHVLPLTHHGVLDGPCRRVTRGRLSF